MRPKERIPIFLEKVNFDTLQERWNEDISQKLRDIIFTPKVLRYWKKNYDMRFGQMLINLNLIPDSLRIWNDEEDLILLDQNVPFREFMFWGRVYDKNMNRLPKVQRILIKDMTTNHIKAILRDVADSKMGIRMDYLQAFKDEIKLRQNE